ncbi:Glu/Leu/Phe/Val dehydrogenase [Salmonella enterica subsp. diarizonae]|nr:Glu/Leu/Phe/Val dehydrogenase [Salmonella enterica subsp. enterica serovar Java]ECC9193085.1 Glu/Leu/Phe/Val dehydrogenase [Salmonella enterica subsp. diarizonae]EEF7553575.1 Glu/Leu/Phe/Val dehydrogenase [Salmonella enterica subsp. diarizonae serovar 48:i:z]EFQ2326967.1 Glu/Leu/Phe/Val dehydrogenase [Salmonella enterica]ECB7404970.1 Glu/Leu/Phe/Val dehydrogenase [Salmonella enterica subsp. enterica serovar Java]
MNNNDLYIPSLCLEYIDKEERFSGWLVIDDLSYPLSAGGFRVQKGLSKCHLIKMARNMSKKMQIWGIPISGAKSGIDYDPNAKGKDKAIERFFNAITPFLKECYSCGGDLNTNIERLELIAHKLGVVSIKMAIANKQNITISKFKERYSLLEHKIIEDFSLGQLRAGWGVAASAFGLLDILNIKDYDAKIAIQGFGTLAKASILALKSKKIKIIAIADEQKCYIDKTGNGISYDLLLSSKSSILPYIDGSLVSTTSPENIISESCDILLLEAVENVINSGNIHCLKTKAIVPGANLAISENVLCALKDKKIIAMPCFVSGSGGTLVINGLFGSELTANEVLNYMEKMMRDMTIDIVRTSMKENNTPTMVALQKIENKKFRETPYKI